MITEEVIVTLEEINGFRTELADSPEALVALDTIEQCEGYLVDAIPLLIERETGKEQDKTIDDLLEKCRKFICKEEVREALEAGIIAPAIEPISVGVGIPPGLATAISICAFKLGMNKVCGEPKV